MSKFRTIIITLAALAACFAMAPAGRAAEPDQKVLNNLNFTLQELENKGQQNCANHEDRGGKRFCACTISVLNKDNDKSKPPAIYNLLFCEHPFDRNADNFSDTGHIERAREGKVLFNFGWGDVIRLYNNFDDSSLTCGLVVNSDEVETYKVKYKCGVEYEKKSDGVTNWRPDACTCLSSTQPNSNMVVGFDGKVYGPPGTLDHKDGIFDVLERRGVQKDAKWISDLRFVLYKIADLYDTFGGDNSIKIKQLQKEMAKSQVCPLPSKNAPWDCSKPAYAGGKRCCCVPAEPGQAKTKKFAGCSEVTGFAYGGQCPNDPPGTKQFPVPAGGSCDSLAVALTSEEDQGPGISLADILGDAKDLNQLDNFSGPASLIGQGIRVLLSFIGSLALILYIYAGFLWMTAAGSPERITLARNIIIWVTMGVVVMLASYIIVQFLFSDVLLLS